MFVRSDEEAEAEARNELGQHAGACAITINTHAFFLVCFKTIIIILRIISSIQEQ